MESIDADLLTPSAGLLCIMGVTTLLPGTAPESGVITARSHLMLMKKYSLTLKTRQSLCFAIYIPLRGPSTLGNYWKNQCTSNFIQSKNAQEGPRQNSEAENRVYMQRDINNTREGYSKFKNYVC